jgi:FkbM family methyltransferase
MIASIVGELANYRPSGNVDLPDCQKVYVFSDASHFAEEAEALDGSRNVRFALYNDDMDEAARASDARILSKDKASTLLNRQIILVTNKRNRNYLVKAVRYFNGRGRHELLVHGSNRMKIRDSFLQKNIGRIHAVVNALEDHESVVCYLSRVKALMFGDPGYVRISRYRQYGHPVVHADAGDIVVDGGVGPTPHTPLGFARVVGGTGKVFAFEPIQRNVASIRSRIAGVENVELIEKGLWDKDDTAVFTVEGPTSTQVSRRVAFSGETEAVVLTSIDNFAAGAGRRIDLIKLDIEGAEQKALAGARGVIERDTPKVQVCLYHSERDFLDIPLILKGYNPSYRLFVGHHTPYGNECVLYGM